MAELIPFPGHSVRVEPKGEKTMTLEQAQTRALLSILDVLEELCHGLAWGQKPEAAWAQVVSENFNLHRAELRDPEGHVEPEL